MTELLTIRHGPTGWNADGRIQGRTDIPLSPEGRARVQAWRLPAGLARFDGEADWVTSPLLRAAETARLLRGLADGAGAADVKADDRLVEMAYGAWEGRLRAEVEAGLRASLGDWGHLGLDFAPPGGESPRRVQARLRPFLAERAACGRATVAVCHKGVIRALYALATGWAMTTRPPEKVRDDCAHLFSLSADGTPAVVRMNVPLLAPAAAPP
jgi:probable phosphoglycerate mutase